MGRNARGAALGFATALALAFIPAVAQAAVTGALTQLASPNNCIQPAPADSECGTGDAKGLFGAQDVASSPDGKNVYVASNANGAIAEFARNSDGSLTQLSGDNACISHLPGSCAKTATGLQNPQAIIVSPDGQNVYVAGFQSERGAIAEFTRNADGSLTQLAAPNDCIEQQTTGSGCGTKSGHGMGYPAYLAISPDGMNVYLASRGQFGLETGAIAAFARDPATGALTQLGHGHNCIEEQPGTDACGNTGVGLTGANRVMVSSDGKNVYTGTTGTPGAVAEFTRNSDGSLTQLASPNDCIASGGTECGTTTGLGIDNIFGLAGSPDGKNVYTASNVAQGPIAEFSRDAASGALTQLASPNNCIEEHGSATPLGCGNLTGHGFGKLRDLKVSPDGKNVYTVSGGYSAVVELARNSDGSLGQLAPPDDCIEEAGGSGDCAATNGRGLTNPMALTISADGANLYVASNAQVDPLAEFGRALPPAAPSTPPAASSTAPQPQTAGSPAPKTAVKAVKKHRHKKRRKAHKALKARRVQRPTFTG